MVVNQEKVKEKKSQSKFYDFSKNRKMFGTKPIIESCPIDIQNANSVVLITGYHHSKIINLDVQVRRRKRL